MAGRVPASLTQHARHRSRANAPTKSIANLLDSPRWQRVLQCRRASAATALGQHGHEGSDASDVLYVKALAAPLTVNTMPEATLKAFADHGEIGPEMTCRRRRLRGGSGGVRARPASTSTRSRRQLQDEGAASFVASWNELMGVIASKSAVLGKSRLRCATKTRGSDPMTAGTRPPDQRPAWAALEAHQKAVAPLHLRKLFADDPQRGERLVTSRPPASTSTTRRTASPTRRCGCCCSSRRSPACASASTRCSAASKINVSENRAVLHVALRAPKGLHHFSSTARTSCRRSTPCSTR